jgi:hypothetical protein
MPRKWQCQDQLLLLIKDAAGVPIVESKRLAGNKGAEPTRIARPMASASCAHPSRGGVVGVEAAHTLRSVAGEGEDSAVPRRCRLCYRGCVDMG